MLMPLLRQLWAVFLLYSIPFGPGIPGGVLLAKKYGLSWVWMELVYFLSDVVQAVWFEALLLWAIAHAKKSEKMRRVAVIMREYLRRTTAPFGTAGGPVALVTIAFGVDPLTGRTAAKLAGHGFLTGWALAITGDMMYFTLLMVSTLWLNRWLNPTATVIVVIAGMIFVPGLIQRLRERVKKAS